MNSKQLTAMGMPDGVPGHYLKEIDNPHPNWGDNYVWMGCDCGHVLSSRTTKSGTLGSRVRRDFADHVAAVTAPEEVIPIGRVNRKRLSVEVVVMSPTYSRLELFHPRPADRFQRYHSIVRIRQVGLWVVGHRKSTGDNVIDATYSTRFDAIEASNRWVREQARPGVEVELAGEGVTFDVPSFSPAASLAALMDEIDECIAGDDLAKFLQVRDSIDEALRLFPILEAKRDAFHQRFAEVLGR